MSLPLGQTNPNLSTLVPHCSSPHTCPLFTHHTLQSHGLFLFFKEIKCLVSQGLFNCANISVRIFSFCFSKLLACPLFSDCSLHSFSSVWLFWTSYRPPPPPPHTSRSIYITLFYLVALILLEIILFICFILYCLLHHPSYLSFILEYKFNESTDYRNLFFFLIFTDWSPVTNPLPDTQLASKSFLNECKCKHSQRST